MFPKSVVFCLLVLTWMFPESHIFSFIHRCEVGLCLVCCVWRGVLLLVGWFVFWGREVVGFFWCLFFFGVFFFPAAVMPYVQFALTINEDFYKLLHSFLYILLFFFPHTFLKPGRMLK